jgi:hypothetical protein
VSLHETAARAVLSEVAGRHALVRAASVLGAAGIAVVPLKGVWLQACVYRGRGTRAITDVDVLVRERDFDAALAALARDGFRARERHTRSEQALSHPALQLPLDLHCRLFTRGAFRLSTQSLFERARPDAEVFGVPLLLPDARDVYAHLIGHFIKSRTSLRDRARIADFVAIADQCRLDAGDLARHLDAAGMARAARYVLHDIAGGGDSFSRALLAALPRDPVGAGVAAVARAVAEQLPATGPARAFGALPGFLLDRSLAAGLRSMVLRLHERATVAGHRRGQRAL